MAPNVEENPGTTSVVKESPETTSPVEESPETASGVKESPETASSVEESPETTSVVKESPETASPVEESPETASVVKESPKTASPVEESPETASVVKESPKTASPTEESRGHVEEEEEIEIPDGGWGWVVVFCSFMIHVIVDGVTYTFGIFYVEFLRYFGESKGATSWVASIMVGTQFCIGPFASGLTNQFGCRTVTFIGAVLAAFGLVVSIVAPNITFLYFSVGVCTGTGFGLLYLPAIVCVTCYFEKRRAFATGIAACGSGVGTSILAPLVELMVKHLGWRGAMVATAGLVLSCCCFGALFRPLQKKPRMVRRMTNEQDLKKGSLPNGTNETNGEICLRPLKLENMHPSTLLGTDNHSKQSPLHETREASSMTLSCGTTHFCKHDVKEGTEQKVSGTSVKSRFRRFLCPPIMIEAFKETMNFKLMTNVIFVMFGVSNFFACLGFNVPYVYTKDRTIGMNISDETNASFLLSIIGIANTVGRVVLGFVSDRRFVNRLWLYNGCLALCGFSTALSSFCLSYEWMAVYAVVFGATSGAYVGLTSVILVDLLGLDKLTNAFGLVLLFQGVACLIGPPITGWLYDFTGSYDPGFYASGTMIAISGLMLFFIPCVQRYSDEREKKKVPSIDASPVNAV